MKSGLYYTFNFKNLFSAVLISCLVLSFLFFIASPEETRTASSENIEQASNIKQLIVIDAGHGGEDGGTVSSKGVSEKLINLKISKKLKSVLTLCGYKVKMTREDDKLICEGAPETIREKKVSDLRNRLKIATSDENGVLLSIHQNHFTESKYWGAQTFYSANNVDSKNLAEHIQNSIVKHTQIDNKRKIKESGKEIYLLHNIKIPAVMVECGFMSNPSEALKLEDENYQIKITLSITEGLNNYFDTKGAI